MRVAVSELGPVYPRTFNMLGQDRAEIHPADYYMDGLGFRKGLRKRLRRVFMPWRRPRKRRRWGRFVKPVPPPPPPAVVAPVPVPVAVPVAPPVPVAPECIFVGKTPPPWAPAHGFHAKLQQHINQGRRLVIRQTPDGPVVWACPPGVSAPYVVEGLSGEGIF